MGAPTAGLQAWSADQESTGPSLSLSAKKGPSPVCPGTVLRRPSLRNSLGPSVTGTAQTAGTPQQCPRSEGGDGLSEREQGRSSSWGVSAMFAARAALGSPP